MDSDVFGEEIAVQVAKVMSRERLGEFPQPRFNVRGIDGGQLRPLTFCRLRLGLPDGKEFLYGGGNQFGLDRSESAGIRLYRFG
jgi:hypothetical protein